MKIINLFLISLTTIFILLVATGCSNEISNNNIKNCETNSGCLKVLSIEGLDHIPEENEECGCSCSTSINKKYLDFWEEKIIFFKDKIECNIDCKECTAQEDYTPICNDNKCELIII